MDKELRKTLRQAYAAQVGVRDARIIDPWKIAERDIFLDELRKNGARSLLEVGAGTGQDAAFFAANGLDVLATDLTEENVAACKEKGLAAEVLDICDLYISPESFDAVFSLNCLLHVPKSEFPVALANIRRTLKPNGFFYLGLYGGIDSEGIYEEDTYKPKRFFSFWDDENLKRQLAPLFHLLRFHTVALEQGSDIHFQSLILRKPSRLVPG
ncbi:MAG: class I SAM-dependent methyltransferase [Anaerolineales bacterium]